MHEICSYPVHRRGKFYAPPGGIDFTSDDVSVGCSPSGEFHTGTADGKDETGKRAGDPNKSSMEVEKVVEVDSTQQTGNDLEEEP